MSEFPKIIGQHLDDLLVALDGDNATAMGFVIGTDEDGVKWRYRDTLIGTILAHSPGWEPYTGKLTVDEALLGAKSQVPMKAVTQYEWTDEGWSPVAVYLFAREMVMGRACEGRPDIAAWVEAVRASARWSPGQNLQDLATEMCEQFSHQEYGSLYEEVEPAPSLGLLAAREFAGLKTPSPVVEGSEAGTFPPGMTWTPGNFDYLTSNDAEAVAQASGLNPEQAGGSALRPVSDPTSGPMCLSCGSSHVARYLYGEPAADPQLETRIRDGHVVLGGCVVCEDQPDFRCNECGFEFRADGPSGAGHTATNVRPSESAEVAKSPHSRLS